MKRFYLLGAFVLLLTMGSGCWDAAEHTSIDLVAPETVAVGDVFDVTLEVTNHGDEVHVIDSIDIANDVLDGFEVFSVDPEPAGELSLEPFLDQYSYTMELDVEANGSQTVTFSLGALEEGSYDGSFDVCMDSGGDCLFSSIHIDVEPIDLETDL